MWALAVISETMLHPGGIPVPYVLYYLSENLLGRLQLYRQSDIGLTVYPGCLQGYPYAFFSCRAERKKLRRVMCGIKVQVTGTKRVEEKIVSVPMVAMTALIIVVAAWKDACKLAYLKVLVDRIFTGPKILKLGLSLWSIWSNYSYVNNWTAMEKVY